MAYVSTPIAFSGAADSGQLQIQPADVYVGTLDAVTHEITNSKYVGYTNQQLSLSISQEEKEYKQNGVAVFSQPISKEATAKFRFDQWDSESLGFALGLSSYMTDSANGKKRVIVSANNITPVDWYLIFETKTANGTAVRFHIPRAQVNIEGDIAFGGGNDSPNFGGLSITAKALAATVNSTAGGTEEALAFYEYDYTNVVVTSVTGLPTTLAIGVAETVKVVPVLAPASATDQRVTWTTSAAAKATVSADGTITGVAAGTANITCTSVSDPTKTDVCAVTVS